MDYVEGGPILTRLEDIKHFSEKEAANVMTQLLQAINYCHEKGIIHRDISTENVYFTSKSGSDFEIKIRDFG
jgi:serine/threonine protein kinase